MVALKLHRIDVQQLGKVLGLPSSNPVEALSPTAVGAPHHCCAHENAARLGHRLQPRRDVDAIAKHVVIVFDDIAEIDADTELERSFGEAGLDFDCRIKRLVHARECRQEPIARRLETSGRRGARWSA